MADDTRSCPALLVVVRGLPDRLTESTWSDRVVNSTPSSLVLSLKPNALHANYTRPPTPLSPNRTGSIRTIQRDFLRICRFLSRLVLFLGNHLHRLFIIRLHPLGHDLGRIECRCGEYDDDFRALLWERSAFGFWGTCCCTFHYPPAYDGRSRSMSPFDRSTGC